MMPPGVQACELGGGQASPAGVAQLPHRLRYRLADTCERDSRTVTFLPEHRLQQAYSDALANAGLLIERIREVGDPSPAGKWPRIPLFLHIRAPRS